MLCLSLLCGGLSPVFWDMSVPSLRAVKSNAPEHRGKHSTACDWETSC